MRYDLLDAESGNLFGRFPTEADALASVRALIEANGSGIAETLVLGGRENSGRVLPEETGSALARRAMAEPAKRHLITRRV